MALPVEFIDRVLAWPSSDEPGYVNLHWQAPKDRGGGMRGRPFTSLQDFMDFAQYAATKPGTYKELFFCLSTQMITGGKTPNGREKAHRHHSKAVKLKAIWLDVDVKPQEPEKAYTSLKDALAAVTAMTKDADLPPPSALVFSGGGVHVYWISNRSMTPEQWRPFAEGLKMEALRTGLKCDAGVTTDSVRVLRIPGTFNNKIEGLPRPVKLAHLGDSYDFNDAKFQRLAALAPAVVKNVVTGAVTGAIALPAAFDNGPHPMFAHLDAKGDTLAAGIGRHNSDLPLDPKEVFKGCKHFKESFTSHGAGQSQGLWMLNALASTWLDNGRRIFHTLSKGYPTYSPDETDAMYDRKVTERAANSLGWPSCKALEGEGAKCQGCPFYNKLRSPLNLAERVDPPEPPPKPVTTYVPPACNISLPDGYLIDENGYIAKIVEKELANGETKTLHVNLFWSQLRNMSAQGGNRCLTFETSLDKGHWGEVVISEGVDMINETTIIGALCRGGVKPNRSIPAKEILIFMTAFMTKLDNEVERQRVVSFGWLRSDEANENSKPIGFAFGGKVYMNDGSERQAGYTDPQLNANFTPKGSPEPWKMLHDKIMSQHHPALECIAATGFAAPLQICTAQNNAVVCSYSNGSGAHKSTSIALGAGVWGNPKMTKEKPISTQKGVFRKLGYLKNLPVFWDEINSDELMDNIREILGALGEGTDGTKLKSNREMHEVGEWQTLMQVGANCSLCENVLRVVKHTDAAFQRVFEYKVEKRADNENITEMDRLVGSINYNYGHMGIAYAKLLAKDFDRIDAFVKESRMRFDVEVEALSEERMRSAAAAAIWCGAMLANELGCKFNVDEMWVFLKAEFLGQRQRLLNSDSVAGTADNASNSFTQYLKQYNKNALWVGNLGAVAAGKPKAVVYIAGPTKQRPEPIHIRLSVDDRVIDFSKQKFADYLTSQGIVAASVLDGLRKHFGGFDFGRINLAAGSGVLGGKEQVFRIPVALDGPFYDDLYANTPPDQRPAPPVAAAVT